VEQQVALAIILLFVGLFVAWLSYYMYNRYQARLQGVSKFRFDAAWQKADNKELSASDAKTTVGNSGKEIPMKSIDKNIDNSNRDTSMI